ncbi:hypothetical protein EX30DRAFT_319573 [Ascodesmis nigricans]|uniref:Uncharacterized protein n=1 Tax=Ascodesmis nigricans TaxID=341454 RepID=A0A4S2MX54_9PEZI|nr:hypothetical protein EX30DRAFT_319573 [Ascodesmis nigricans]
MNSVATTPAVQGQPPPGLPAKVTKEYIEGAFQRYRALKDQGMNESNPEFLHLHRILQYVQRQQVNARNKQLQQMQQSANGGPGQAANGRATPVRPSSQQSGNLPSGSSPTTRRPPDGATNANLSPLAGGGQQNSAGSATFTNEQLAVLRSQIMAYKFITRNQPVPPHVRLAYSYPPKTDAPVFNKAAAEAVIDGIQNASGEGKDAKKPRSGYETFTSPWINLKDTISYAEHGNRAERKLIPSIMPVGIDVRSMLDERERVKINRINARKAELEELPANIADADANKNLDVKGDALKLKALIEYKALCLLPKQRLLKQQMVDSMVHADTLAITANRAMFRRMKKQSLREARITERLEKQQRDQREARERRKHVEYIQGVINRGAEIKNDAREREARAQKLGRMMLQHHQFMEKEEQKRMERTAKQRLQALKDNNEEAYLQLLDKAKDTRITHLLSQTDSFLKSLAESVRAQQRQAIQNYGDEVELPEEDDSDDETEKVDYYAVAHRIKEEITMQPSILVGGTLKEYQLKGLQWMISLYNNNLNGILADEMGLGKTIQTISLITYLIERKKQNGPFLVIVPLSTLTNWTLEFEKWAPAVGKIVYKGPPTARKTQQNQIRFGNWQVLLTTYEYVIKDRPILSKIKWNYMIIDEGHRMKNSQSKLSFTLTTYYNCRFRLILTGTPLQNNLPELWNLLNFVLPTIFKSVKSFDEWFNTPFANTGGNDKMELTEEEALLIIRRLHKVLRPFLLRRLKKDVESELPDKVEKVIKCRFSSLQQKLYRQMTTHGMMFVNDAKEGGKMGVRGLSNMIMQLRKLCNHPFVFEEVESAINPTKINNDTLWRTAGKFELLDRLLPKFFATNHKCLIFFQMTQIMNIMEDFLQLRGYKYLRLDGSTKADDRSALLKQFNAPDSPYFIFLLSTRAGGLGLNLQSADTVIIYDSDWNPHQDLQAQDRAHRIGQKNEVRILRLITSNSVEERILERAQYKLDIDGKVIQAGKFDNKSTNEERDALLRIMLEGEDKEDADNEELDDDELNEICSRNDQELILFKKMDEERNRDPLYGSFGNLPRLMSEAELPDVYLQEHVAPSNEPTGPVGRGARERKIISYDDGLTEEQWSEAIDDDDDTVEDAIRRKQQRIERRATNKARRMGEYDESPGPESPGPASSSPPTVKKKRGRKSAAEKRRMEEETPEPKSKKRQRVGKGGYVVSDGLTPGNRAMLQSACEAIYDHVKAVEDPETGRPRFEIFDKLPSKKLFPDYYHIIKTPISFNEIRKRMRNGDYTNLDLFKADFKQMFENARTYNEEGSMVYEDANAMDAEFDIKFAEEKRKYDEVNGAQSLDGTSTAPISSTGTPIGDTPNARMKAKAGSNASPDYSGEEYD